MGGLWEYVPENAGATGCDRAGSRAAGGHETVPVSDREASRRRCQYRGLPVAPDRARALDDPVCYSRVESGAIIAGMRPESSRNGRPIGKLESGEPYYAPIGRMRYDGDRVQCHLCGRWLKKVGGSHLIAAHGITTAEYREMFHLYTSTSTIAPETAERKRASMLEQFLKRPTRAQGASPAWTTHGRQVALVGRALPPASARVASHP